MKPSGPLHLGYQDTVSCDSFARLLEIMLPGGGHLMALIEAYFDESGSHRGAHVICVAGYVFEKDGAIALTHEWRDVLHYYELPYFRMSDCAHGNGPFAKLSKSERVAVQTAMIGIIKRHTIQGIAATLNKDEFLQCMPQHPLLVGYSFTIQVILAGLRGWIRHNEERGAPIEHVSYFFEAGHASRGQANRIMDLLFSNAGAKAALRYSGHAFVEKEKTPCVQAADLLAWQWYTDKRHELEGKPRRKDCESLLQHHHNAVHLTPEAMTKLANEPVFNVEVFEASLRGQSS